MSPNSNGCCSDAKVLEMTIEERRHNDKLEAPRILTMA